jgi:hypothetical protein
MKFQRLFMLGAIFAVCGSLVATAIGKTEDEDSRDDDNDVTIEKLILVRVAGDNFIPVESFKTTDNLGVLVKLSGSKLGTKVKGVWTVIDAGGMKDKKIFEKEVTITEEGRKDRVDFTLSHDNPYPTGNYKFEVYLKGEMADSVDFTIE